MSLETEVVITGVGIEIPGIEHIRDFLGALQSPLEGGEFTPEKKLGRKGLRYKDRATLLAFCAAKSALEGAMLPTTAQEQQAPERFGVVVSSNLGNLDTVCNVVGIIRENGVDHTSPMDLPIASSNVIPASLAIKFGLKAVNLMICNGAHSGIDSLYFAANAIRAGRADRILVVGVEPLNPVVAKLMEESAQPYLRPSKSIRSGEAAGAVVLESQRAAEERCVPIYGTVSDYRYHAKSDSYSSSPFPMHGNEVLPDLWMIPHRAYSDAGEFVDGVLGCLGGNRPEILDLGVSLGEVYGALGVLQCIVACLWLRQHKKERAIATSGFCLGDGASSLAIRAD